jgi:hypothetical protein
MHEYTFGEYVLEFTPNSGTKGYLTTTVGETTYGANINIASIPARKKYVEETRGFYPEAFEDETSFQLAIMELSVQVVDQANLAEAKAAEEAEEAPADAVAENTPEEGSPRYGAAMEILGSDDIFEEVAKTMQRFGHVGEWANKKLAFACAVSARAQQPVQPSTHAASAAGKNHLWDNVLALIPPELVYKRTGFSAKALFRTKMSLKHSVLYIQELAGSEGADFSIRTLQSDGVLRWEATEKQSDGTMANVEYEVEGPCVIVQTTTKNHLHPENETRVVPLYLDESPTQTKRITDEVKRRAAGKGAISEPERRNLCEKWHDAVRLLEPVEVLIPYAERIQVPDKPIRLRRDFPRLLNIIRLVAWIHQYSRKRDEEGRIVATENDFEKAITMVGDSFARAWKFLTPAEEKVYDAVTEHLSQNLQRHGFKRSHVEDALAKAGIELSLTATKDALQGLTANGFLESDGKRGASGATYTVAKATSSVKNISLAPSGRSAINQKSGEFGIGKTNLMAGDDSGHSRPFGCSMAFDPVNGRKAENGQNGFRPFYFEELGVPRPKNLDLEANGRTAGPSQEVKNEIGEGGVKVDFEYIDEE